MTLSRRDFLKKSAVGMSAFLLPPGLSARASTNQNVLVAIYQRGAADGLSLVIPVAESLYYTRRPSVQVAPGSELPLDSFFGLNPVLADLLPLYQSGELCMLHACGSPDPSRSHFDAQDFMEHAAPGNKNITDGWLNRFLLVSGTTEAIAGITLSGARVKALAGAAPSLAFSGISSFAVRGQSETERRAALESRYSLIPGSLLGSNALDAFSAIDLVARVPTGTTAPYPENSSFGEVLSDAAALIKADIGVRVIAINIGGWDHHSDTTSRMAGLGAELGASLAAFHEDLGACASTTLTLCMTEFGRRLRENGAGGTDHGRASVMWALGGGVAGGRVLADWPGLADEDLAVTTDFRDVFAEVLNRHMGLSLSAMTPVFPNFTPESANFPGLYA